MNANIPPRARHITKTARAKSESIAAEGLPAIAAELRKVAREMDALSTVEYPLRLLMIAVAMIAERG